MTFNFLHKISFVIIGAVCFLPFTPAWAALLAGIFFALSWGTPNRTQVQLCSKTLLAFSIVGLGAGINLSVIAMAGFGCVFYTVISILFAMALGFSLGRLLKLDGNISSLITVGTAICGGSAIAACAPVLKAKEHEITIALAVVFSLNALALLIFPAFGHWAGLSQEQFGLWAALAIHDTSSVVGATMQYGGEALEVGTTVKLVRALWIIPLVLGLAFFMSQKEARDGEEKAKIKLPWFIVGFIAMSALVTFIPSLQSTGEFIAEGAKRLLVFTLFLIGASLSKEALRQVGFRPLVYGAMLWLLIASASLFFIAYW